ncbi:DNA methyltransferase [Spiroplasma platyhelix]|uniref:Site-specific DNA-methyltransferase n=1 Tax=Spiroplasma platyhelix PALS-1 TaxID=1276218 RepID=A0A846U1E2_9MOLU|nr:DNA methyltransferase [Spiroplasma platyhelix]MBE4703956.1 hypothetical protein [Spiroplasma platyhelix PALS-1]NKE38329.1 site-specific DNA-methyltransferase [Spiroplasma platyhelix PALS-1]UJB29214.1 type II R/M system DNA methylase [Spiroplasma platyhelix PALS-1]
METNMDIVIHQDFRTNIIESLPKETTWKNYSRLWGDHMHRICSYVAMFPPSLANFFIKEYSEENDIVLDTFSGRGTTLLQSRLLNRKTYAIDLNPFAYVLSRAKSQSFKIEEVLKRIRYWEKKYFLSNFEINIFDTIYDDLRVYYSDKNLHQLIFIKENLGKRYNKISAIDNFILAITLGIMHGPMRKNGDSIYFSLSMSNHTSMSVNYVKKYSLNHNLIKPEDNIFEKINNRVIYILKKSKYCENIAQIKLGNALEIKKYFDIKPKLIFTSPPYLNLINYTKQNWIKMWMLGFNNNEDNNNIKLDDRHGFDDYKKFMTNYLLEIAKMCDQNTRVILVIGDARNRKMYNYFDIMWDQINKDVPFLLQEYYSDDITQAKKATNSLGKKAGKATRVDKMYVFKLKK